MKRTIVDCYTDEPAGLGVPPFLGVYPRYVAGGYDEEPDYLTIDDVRSVFWPGRVKKSTVDPIRGRTKVELLNSTRSRQAATNIVERTDEFIVIAGIQTPGKYLSALPGTPAEAAELLRKAKGEKILSGPAALCGSQAIGGTVAEDPRAHFEKLEPLVFDSYDLLQGRAVKGAALYSQMPMDRCVEIETGRGCYRDEGCSFCTEPIKSDVLWRDQEDIIEEIRACMSYGAKWFRLGKQSCIFSYKAGDLVEIEKLLKGIVALGPELLHIDNVNPTMVTRQRAALFVKYLTPGSTAAMGVECFDPDVVRLNNLNATPEVAREAIRIINEVGAGRDDYGRYSLLPGVNLLLGLNGESEASLEMNYTALKGMLMENLLIRRINIRHVVPFPGTPLYLEAGTRFVQKNRRFYAKWIERIRQEVDVPMLAKLYPLGMELHDLYSEVHEGSVTFMRQPGSYPIVVGVRERLELGERFSVRITGHNPRSLNGEVS